MNHRHPYRRPGRARKRRALRRKFQTLKRWRFGLGSAIGITITYLLLLCGCAMYAIEPRGPVPPASPPGLPFPRTQVTEAQRNLQEQYKLDPNMPHRTGLVIVQKGE